MWCVEKVISGIWELSNRGTFSVSGDTLLGLVDYATGERIQTRPEAFTTRKPLGYVSGSPQEHQGGIWSCGTVVLIDRKLYDFMLGVNRVAFGKPCEVEYRFFPVGGDGMIWSNTAGDIMSIRDVLYTVLKGITLDELREFAVSRCLTFVSYDRETMSGRYCNVHVTHELAIYLQRHRLLFGD